MANNRSANYDGYGMPEMDFSIIGNLGNVYDKAKQGAVRERTLAELGQGPINYSEAAQKLLAANMPEEAFTLARLGQADAAQKQAAAFHGDTVAHQNATLAETRRQHDLAESKPMLVPAGTGLYDRKGNAIVAPESQLDKQTITDLANQLRKGDTSVLTNLGRGGQGAMDIRAIRTEAARLNREEGLGGGDQATQNADYKAGTAGLRTMANRNANIEYAANTANRAIDIADTAVDKLPRTQFLPVNRLIQAWQTNTGSPEQVAAGAAVNTLVNEYARVVSPTGVPTEGTRQHAREMLQSAFSHEQFKAVTGMMRQEIISAKAAGGQTRQELRDNISGKKSEPAPAAPAAAPRVIDWQTYFSPANLGGR